MSGKELTFFKSNLVSSSLPTRTVQFEGNPHLVVPVVLMVEGVHSGSAGPLFYSSSALAESAHLWNGTPVPVYHPEDDRGFPVSCNSPEVIERRTVGRLFNVQWEGDKNRIKGEVWLNIGKAQNISPEVLSRIQQGLPLEVSTGLFSDDVMIPGTWNGEEYIGTVQSIRPDHLALLPGMTGACSWADGCGIRNQEKGGLVEKEHKDTGMLESENKKMGFFIRVLERCGLISNEHSYENKRRAVQKSLDALDNQTQVHYMSALYDDYVVYEVGPGSQSTTPFSEKLFKRGWTMDENGGVSLDDKVEEVRQEVSYVGITKNEMKNSGEMESPVDHKNSGNEIDNTKTALLNEEEKMDRKEKVNKLISNGHFTEEDRDFLEKSPCEQFSRIELMAQPKPVKENTESTPAKVSEEDIMKNLPENIKTKLNAAEAILKKERDDLIAGIKGNKANKISDATLDKMPVEALKEIAASLTPTANYEGAQGGAQVIDNEAKEEPMELPVISYEEK